MAQRLLLGVALVGVIPGANAFVPVVRGLPRGPSALPAFQLPTLELPDMSALFTGGDSSPKGPRASDVFELFDGGVDANSVAAACASSVTWVDLDASTPAEGPEAVAKLMEKKYEGATMVVDRVADGVRSSGATLYYDSEAGSGRRGTMYVEVDDAGLITFVQEAWEPLYKVRRSCGVRWCALVSESAAVKLCVVSTNLLLAEEGVGACAVPDSRNDTPFLSNNTHTLALTLHIAGQPNGGPTQSGDRQFRERGQGADVCPAQTQRCKRYW